MSICPFFTLWFLCRWNKPDPVIYWAGRSLKAANSPPPPPPISNTVPSYICTLPIWKAVSVFSSNWRVSKQTWVVVVFCFFFRWVDVLPLWGVKGQTGCSSCPGNASWANTRGRVGGSSAVGSQSVQASHGGWIQPGLALTSRGSHRWGGHLTAGGVNFCVYSSSLTTTQKTSGPHRRWPEWTPVSGAFLLNPTISDQGFKTSRSQHYSPLLCVQHAGRT